MEVIGQVHSPGKQTDTHGAGGSVGLTAGLGVFVKSSDVTNTETKCKWKVC